jgi:succinyl-CoA synthetase alpha subunit
VVIVARSNTKANEVINQIKKEGGKGQAFFLIGLSGSGIGGRLMSCLMVRFDL